MNVLFSHSYFLRFDPKQWEIGQPYAPLGTIYAAALLRDNGYPVSLFDTMFAESPQQIRPILEETMPDIFVVYDDGFNYLTKMCLTNMREAAFDMIQAAKENGCIVIVSSSDATDHCREYLDKKADFVILGEAEITLLSLCNSIKEGKSNYADIAGLAYLENNKQINTPKRSVLRELDDLPAPAWDLVDVADYRQRWMKQHGYFSINVATTRGCPFKCNWCAKPIYGNRYNSRSPQHVFDELLFLKEQYNIDHIWFCDDIFGLKPGWVKEFARLIAEHQLLIKFKIQSRADLLLQDDYIKDLAIAGCDNVWMGAESGSQKILDAMDKGITVQQIHTASSLLKKQGIKPSLFIQFGYLDETRDDINKTIKMIDAIMPHSIGVSVSYPLPGTVFYEKVKATLKEKTNWTDSDELAMMFSNTYPPAFYKQLHRYVQKNFNKRLAIATFKKIVNNLRDVNIASMRKIASLAYYIPAVFWDKVKLNQLERKVSLDNKQ